MASRRFLHRDAPVQEIGLRSAKLFKDDIEFIQARGQHPRTMIREALHIYVDAWRTANYLPVMSKKERDQFIMTRVPCLKILHTRSDPVVDTHENQPITIRTNTPSDIIKRPSIEEMRDWTKGQRDIYILYGTVP